MEKFGDQLPTKEQWEELKDKFLWYLYQRLNCDRNKWLKQKKPVN